MDRLAVLKFCRDELAERQRNDPWQGWFWGIRRKVITYWISVLERTDAASGSASGLTPAERQVVRSSHPLLAPRPVVGAAVLQPDRDWQSELRRRVETYIAAVKSHR